MNQELQNQVKNMPTVPGVYIYRDVKKEIIYVGKAKNLKNRVGSYFQGNLDPLSKTKALVDKINELEYIEVASEFEALILEAELIKKYRPKYNISLKDDKSYLYIVLRSDKVDINGTLYVVPKVLTARRPDLLKNDTVFGPYPDGQTAKVIIRTIRKIIPYRDCTTIKFARYAKIQKPCLYGYIGLCQAPCVNIDKIPAYRKDVQKIKRLLKGESTSVINSLRREMQHNSKLKNFELAAHYRDTLNNFLYVTQSFKTAQSYIDNPYLIDDVINKSLSELMSAIPALTKAPERIECFDIANISGKEAVGSMTVAILGRIDKREYKRFKVNVKDEPDDFEMMREVLRRRLSHEEWSYPDLLVVDGGKGQVSAAHDVITELNLNVNIIGLAKRLETIVIKTDTGFVEINLDKSNEGLKLLQRLRDEAHRFAQAYHHKLMLKRMTPA